MLALSLAAVGLSLGWKLFAQRTAARTSHAETSGVEDVTRIWGGPLEQPQPVIAWRRTDAATVELVPGELSSSTIDVELDGRYRRRGLTEFPGYEVKLDAKYAFENPANVPSFVMFQIGLPVERKALMLTELELQIDGKSDPDNTRYTREGIEWSGSIPAQHTATIQVGYRARGLGRFGYALSRSKSSEEASVVPVNKFQLAMRVRNVEGELDYPVGSMTPALVEETGGSRLLVWKVDRLLSSFDVGLVLPSGANVTSALVRLTHNAPWFFALYSLGLMYALTAVRRHARALHLLALSGSYFLYFPLATYLTAYASWPVASLGALFATSGLAIFHALRFIGRVAAIRIAACQLFFLAAPAMGYLLPAHTGLILIVAGLSALAVAMQAIGRVASKLDESQDDEPRGATSVVESPSRS